ncbi:MAG: Uma2 family endonuclease [Planctomycetia bacterium]|nr:Uma2 family endonuclease [Planctomycetia bacterium]
MSTLIPRSHRYSVEEFFALVGYRGKTELIDGIVRAHAVQDFPINSLALWLARVMAEFVDRRDLGEVHTAPVAYWLEDRAIQPDISFISKRRSRIVRGGGIARGLPDLAVELAVGQNVLRDEVEWQGRYEQAGIREYWIIDPDKRSATFLTLGDGEYRKVRVIDHLFRSVVLPGFCLDVRWLWRVRRPTIIQALDKTRPQATRPTPRSTKTHP